MSGSVSWGILGTGRIARTFAEAIATSRTGHLAAVATRAAGPVAEFLRQYGAKRAFSTYEALLEDPAVQAVYISTPHPFHKEWAIGAAQAGKHILCEKPLAMNHPEAAEMVAAARTAGVFLMEAFMYRCHPQTARAVEIVRSGRLGEIRLIRATFGFLSPHNPESRLHRKDLGGGAILDIGCYCMSMARLLAGAATGKAFAEPVRLEAFGTLGPESGSDQHAEALLDFGGGLFAQLSAAFDAPLGSAVTVFGSSGSLHIPVPWTPGRTGGIPRLEITTDGTTETLEIHGGVPLYSLEIDAVAASLEAGESPCMPLEDTLGNMAALDRWRTAVGIFYD